MPTTALEGERLAPPLISGAAKPDSCLRYTYCSAPAHESDAVRGGVELILLESANEDRVARMMRRFLRWSSQDAAFGFRQLVDIAVRALSPGVNDPTTAVEVLDRLHDLLRSLVQREIPNPVRVDESGRLRLVLPRPS